MLGPGPGADEAFEKRAVVSRSASRGEQNHVRDVLVITFFNAGLGDLFVGQRPSSRPEPRRDGDINVRGTEIRAGLINVQMLGRHIAERHFLRRGPAQKVVAGRAGDPANFAQSGKALERPVVGDIFLLAFRPEGKILRVETGLSGGRKHGLIPQLPPMDAVSGSERHQTGAHGPAESFIPFVFGNTWARSRKGLKSDENAGSARITLLRFDPFTAVIPSSGFVQWMPSEDSA